MVRSWRVYALSDPRTGEVRYVGMTHRRDRIHGHVYSARRRRTHVACWVQSLLAEGLRPDMVDLEEGVGNSWVECERYWIAVLRTLGAQLTNLTDGGEGALGWSPDADWRRAAGERAKRVHTGKKRDAAARARMSAAQRRIALERAEQGLRVVRPPRSAETLRRMSEAQTGKTLSSETRRKIGEATRNASPELRAQWAEAARSRPAEWRAWFAKNQSGRPKSEEHKAKIAAALKAAWARKKGAVSL